MATGRADAYTKSMMTPTPYPAPDFSALATDGTVRRLADYHGTWLVLYFYPKDDTPGCTVEACALRDARDDIAALGAEVVGVSRDDAASHEKFKAKHALNFTLLSDPDHVMMDAYGAWGSKQFGQQGVLRKTFIINPDGQVVKAYGRVTPLGHGAQVHDDLQKLQAAALS